MYVLNTSLPLLLPPQPSWLFHNGRFCYFNPLALLEQLISLHHATVSHINKKCCSPKPTLPTACRTPACTLPCHMVWVCLCIPHLCDWLPLSFLIRWRRLMEGEKKKKWLIHCGCYDVRDKQKRGGIELRREAVGDGRWGNGEKTSWDKRSVKEKDKGMSKTIICSWGSLICCSDEQMKAFGVLSANSLEETTDYGSPWNGRLSSIKGEKKGNVQSLGFNVLHLCSLEGETEDSAVVLHQEVLFSWYSHA